MPGWPSQPSGTGWYFLLWLLATTDVSDSEGVAAMDVSVDMSVSLLELDG